MNKMIIPALLLIVMLTACTNSANNTPTPTQPSVTSADGAPPDSIHNLPVPTPVAKVKELIAKELGIETNKVVPIQVTEKDWPNGCLGLAADDEMCTEAIVPGYEIEVQAQNKSFVYRTDKEGTVIRKEK